VGERRPEAGVVAIFPGSRPAELDRHLHPFLDATRDHGTVLVAEAPGSDLRRRLPADPRLHVVGASEAMIRAERALTKSGTVTLELALHGVPSVVAHRVHWLTWVVGRQLVRGIRFLALPNLLLDREVFREFVQHFRPEDLASALRAAQPPPSDALRQLVGPPGVVSRAADLLLSLPRP
jgi:lipid-A-disaccharide synthase